MEAEKVLDFWFEELTPKQWFTKDLALDEQIAERFGELHRQATQAELQAWRKSATGSLAEIIVLDQFSRNIYRDSPRAFAYDGMALVLAQEAIAKGFDTELELDRRAFMYMPFMHSESLTIHQAALRYFATPGLEKNLEFEKRHLKILERFKRYPHRNAILGRKSTAEELAFLKEPNSSF